MKAYVALIVKTGAIPRLVSDITDRFPELKPQQLAGIYDVILKIKAKNEKELHQGKLKNIWKDGAINDSTTYIVIDEKSRETTNMPDAYMFMKTAPEMSSLVFEEIYENIHEAQTVSLVLGPFDAIVELSGTNLGTIGPILDTVDTIHGVLKTMTMFVIKR